MVKHRDNGLVVVGKNVWIGQWLLSRRKVLRASLYGNLAAWGKKLRCTCCEVGVQADLVTK